MARAFAREGAHVHAAGRTLAPLQPVAEAGGVDISFNLLGGLQVAFAALEAASRQLSAELGAAGVRAATLEDVGNVAAFVASDMARTLTASTVNISCGALVD